MTSSLQLGDMQITSDLQDLHCAESIAAITTFQLFASLRLTTRAVESDIMPRAKPDRPDPEN